MVTGIKNSIKPTSTVTTSYTERPSERQCVMVKIVASTSTFFQFAKVKGTAKGC